MRSRRTAVLGGSGFIGRYVVKRLAARGDVVPVGCRNVEEAKFLRPMGDVGQVEPLSVAIHDEVLLPAFVAGSGAHGCAHIQSSVVPMIKGRCICSGSAAETRLKVEAPGWRFW